MYQSSNANRNNNEPNRETGIDVIATTATSSNKAAKVRRINTNRLATWNEDER